MAPMKRVFKVSLSDFPATLRDVYDTAEHDTRLKVTSNNTLKAVFSTVSYWIVEIYSYNKLIGHYNTIHSKFTLCNYTAIRKQPGQFISPTTSKHVNRIRDYIENTGIDAEIIAGPNARYHDFN